MPASQLDALKEAPNVEAFAGEVVLTGPRLAVTLTAAAAAEMARRLTAAAAEAEIQQRGGAGNNSTLRTPEPPIQKS